jgi:phage terminase large subunit-like protein
MTAEELIIFGELAGGRKPPSRPVRELWCAIGRGGGKDAVASLVAAFSAAIEQRHTGMLRPGEKAYVLCAAADREQGAIAKGYVEGYFQENPLLAAMVIGRTANGLLLDNNAEIVISTNSFRAVRGRRLLAVVADEIAFWKDENSATPDIEFYRAVKPGLMRQPGSMFLGISSPYRKAGLLWEKYKQYFRVDDDDVLVIQASSLQMNPIGCGDHRQGACRRSGCGARRVQRPIQGRHRQLRHDGNDRSVD